MLRAPTGLVPGFRWNFSNQSGPSTTPGTSIAPGASNAEGNPVVIATGAQIAHDVYGILFWITGGTTSAAIKNHLMDIGVDPAGGTSYTYQVSDLQIGTSATAINGGITLYVPIYIKAGSQVAVRIQGSNSTAGTVRVMATFYGRPIRPEVAPLMRQSETLGAITSSRGVLVTPGSNGAEGAWTLIGQTTFPWKYHLPLFQIADASANAQVIFLDTAVGDTNVPGDAKNIISENIAYCIDSTLEAVNGGPGDYVQDLWCRVPEGKFIFARLSTTLATLDTNYAVNVTGFG